MNVLEFTYDRPTLQKKDPCNVFFGMLHLGDSAFFSGFMQHRVSPIFCHFCMHDVLIDRSQLIGEQIVQGFNYFFIPFHI